MDDIARAAGVGKGTLFRRFGDRGSLLRAVYDARLGDLRTAIDTGPPPLGPGGNPAERIAALLDSIVDFKLDNRRLAMAIEQDQGSNGPALYGAPHYVATHQLVAQLLAEVIGPQDATWTAYALLAAIRIDLVDFLVVSEQVSRQQLRDDLRRFVERVLR